MLNEATTAKGRVGRGEMRGDPGTYYIGPWG